ncbi:hypothetical protein E3N88_34741 [Mikania micrantha]|uniref:Integrase zinc-binding domain-containing protein n=1 Tax=Mikania micrantha TaxID=192012 RepID=A0A5N6LZ89_9ASTR|nr:hypothetical protein E3N88_34741 [Mikania micrantha]
MVFLSRMELAFKFAFKSQLQGCDNCGAEKHFKTKQDGVIYYLERVWIPAVDELRILILDEAHKTRYSIHLGADKMYQYLRSFYWWPGMKKDVATYVGKCITCAKVKAEH